MDKQPVGQLPDLTQSNNDDEIMVITDSEHNQLKKEKISDFITDLTSTNENNALTKGTDGKMFVTDFGNASNITEGTLPTLVLPEIPLEKLPVSGVTADTYAYPSSVTVNAQGQVTGIVEGAPGANNANQDLSNISEAGKEVIRETAGSDYHLTQNQITNCMLSAPNGVPSYSGTTVTVQEGTNYLFPNGRNSNNSVKNVNFSLASAATGTISGSTSATYCVFVTSELGLIFANQLNYFITNTQPTVLNDSTTQGVWFNPETNLIYQCAATASTPSWSTFEGAICATLTYDGSTITAFNPIYPVELLKRSDKAEITGWGFPSARYDDIELLANNTDYAPAPADGYYAISKGAGINNAGIFFINTNTGFGRLWFQGYSRGTVIGDFPVRKGEVIQINSTATGALNYFRFYYAEGVK